MRYMKVEWHHTSTDQPITIISEIDDAGWERRKIEVFSSGLVQTAESNRQDNDTYLSTSRIPDEKEILMNPEFDLKIIDENDFIEAWRFYTSKSPAMPPPTR